MAKKYPKLGKILKRLLFEHDMKAVDLAREVDVPQPTIHRIITGKSTRPYISSLKPIADFFRISTEQLTGEQTLSGKEQSIEKDVSFPSKIKNVPLIPWNKILDIDTENNQFEKTPCISDISEIGFATLMQDSSMLPLFPKNSILIIDPSVQPTDRSYVLAKLTNPEQIIFRQLIIDLEHKYLKPLSLDLSTFKMRLLDEEDEILGCLVESRNQFSNQLKEDR